MAAPFAPPPPASGTAPRRRLVDYTAGVIRSLQAAQWDPNPSHGHDLDGTKKAAFDVRSRIF